MSASVVPDLVFLVPLDDVSGKNVSEMTYFSAE